jgi:hypothetical protein
MKQRAYQRRGQFDILRFLRQGLLIEILCFRIATFAVRRVSRGSWVGFNGGTRRSLAINRNGETGWENSN